MHEKDDVDAVVGAEAVLGASVTPEPGRASQGAARRLPTRFAAAIIGMILYGTAMAMMVRGAIGVAPWDVLSQGIALRTGLSFGTVTNALGVLVLLAWIPLRLRPGIGTLINVLLVGTAAQAALSVIPVVDALWIRVPLFLAGLVLLAVASGLYLAPQLGAGPRDGLMTGLNERFGLPIWVARTGIEIVVVTIGWILGGNVGVGTLVFALSIGPLCGKTLPWFAARVPGRPTPAGSGG